MPTSITLLVIPVADPDALSAMSYAARREWAKGIWSWPLRSASYVDTFLMKATQNDFGVFQDADDADEDGKVVSHMIDSVTIVEVVPVLEAMVEAQRDQTARDLSEYGGGFAYPPAVAAALQTGTWPIDDDPAVEAAAFAHALLRAGRLAKGTGCGVCWEVRGEVKVRTPVDPTEPPPPAEPLADTDLTSEDTLTVNGLTLAIAAVFTPDRVGMSTGTTATTLVGRFGDTPQTPGTDYTRSEVDVFMDRARTRLGRYRWRVTEVSAEPPRVHLIVDRVALPAKRHEPVLFDGDSRMLWLSTLGVQDMEVFADSRVQYPDYADYVQVELGAYTRDQGASWYAIVRARRVLAGFDNADWELALPLGTDHAQPTVVLGDHRLTVLEVKWESTLPAELHARVWLQRTTTGEGMTKPPPQIPGPPPVPYT